jgi:starch synthase
MNKNVKPLKKNESVGMRILMVSPEITPYAKTGGLGDMVAGMAKALSERGHDVRVVCPFYGSITPDENWEICPKPLTVNLGKERIEYCRRRETIIPASNAIIYFLEYDKYFHRPEIYTGPWGAHADNDERFAFFSRAALDLCYDLEWIPDVIHCHDWTTGLVPVYLNTVERDRPLGKAACVFTVHNLKHQGVFGSHVLDFAGIPYDVYRSDGLESFGAVNMMKGALYHATKITTVSPTYAREIQTHGYGCGLEHVLKFRSADLVGILNGIDTQVWNPQIDTFLPARYSVDNMTGKALCKRALQEHFGLILDSHPIIFAAVARFDPQKGLDLLAQIIPEVVRHMHAQVVVLGTGDVGLENIFRDLAARFPGKLGVHIGYDSSLAHLVEAGADVFVMPSRFEPCGLNQMYSMAYGTPPIVRNTGGLVDTVEQYREDQLGGTGFIFNQASADALYYTMGWACSTYFDRHDQYRSLQRNGMRKDFSWKHSALQYESVYAWAMKHRAGKL